MFKYCLLAYALLVIPADAKQKSPHVDTTTSFNGTCETFTVTRGSDVTDIDCDTKMLQTHWSDGRRGFYFLSTERNNKALVTTFSGMESGSIFLDESSDIVQPIDTLVSNEPEVHRFQAIGKCYLSDQGKPTYSVECEAIIDGGIIMHARMTHLMHNATTH